MSHNRSADMDERHANSWIEWRLQHQIRNSTGMPCRWVHQDTPATYSGDMRLAFKDAREADPKNYLLSSKQLADPLPNASICVKSQANPVHACYVRSTYLQKSQHSQVHIILDRLRAFQNLHLLNMPRKYASLLDHPHEHRLLNAR